MPKQPLEPETPVLHYLFGENYKFALFNMLKKFFPMILKFSRRFVPPFYLSYMHLFVFGCALAALALPNQESASITIHTCSSNVHCPDVPLLRLRTRICSCYSMINSSTPINCLGQRRSPCWNIYIYMYISFYI